MKVNGENDLFVIQAKDDKMKVVVLIFVIKL